MEDERHAGSQLHGNATRRRIASAGDEHHAHTRRARARDGGERAARDALVAREQRAVDVEGEEPAGCGRQRPVQASTFSMTSPGRILSATSMPEATHPNTV